MTEEKPVYDAGDAGGDAGGLGILPQASLEAAARDLAALDPENWPAGVAYILAQLELQAPAGLDFERGTLADLVRLVADRFRAGHW